MLVLNSILKIISICDIFRLTMLGKSVTLEHKIYANIRLQTMKNSNKIPAVSERLDLYRVIVSHFVTFLPAGSRRSSQGPGNPARDAQQNGWSSLTHKKHWRQSYKQRNINCQGRYLMCQSLSQFSTFMKKSNFVIYLCYTYHLSLFHQYTSLSTS